MAVKPRDIVGGFELSKPIADGATGSVWRARAQDTDLPVALKLLKPELLPPSAREAVFATLQDRAATLGKLTHQGLALVFATVSDPERGHFGIATELLEGPTLDEVPVPRPAKGQPLDARTIAPVLAWFHQLAAALAWLHAQGHAHGNLKAKNIVLLYGRERPHPKITDLCWSAAGIPKLAPDSLARAPEQALDSPASPLADQWCVAKLLRDVLTGTTGDQEAEHALAGAPTKLLQILERGLAPQASKRFRDMGAFFYAIENLKNELEAEIGSEESASVPHDSSAPTTMMEAVVGVRPTDPTQPMPAIAARAEAVRRARALEQVVVHDAPSEPFADDRAGAFVELLPRRSDAPDARDLAPPVTEALEPVVDGARRPWRPAVAIAAALLLGGLLLAVGVSWFFGQEEIAAAPLAPVAPEPSEESPARAR